MKSCWSTLKHELIYRRRFATRSQATTAFIEYIESFYNRTRLRSALGFKSPLDYESNRY
jgi:putative transposase